MRDDTECEKCTGREGPAIIAAAIVVPVLVIGLPLLVMRLERTRAFAYHLYNNVFDVGRFKASLSRERTLAESALTRSCARAGDLGELRYQ